MRLTQSEIVKEVESLVDQNGLYEVMAALALMCFEKSEHVQQSYDDRNLANGWNAKGKKIMKLSEQF